MNLNGKKGGLEMHRNVTYMCATSLSCLDVVVDIVFFLAR